MKTGELWGFQDCERETGYSRHSLRRYHGLGKFIEPTRVVGNVYLFEPRAVLKWKRDHVKNRAPAGAPSPEDNARKRKVM